jgi:hypothetical protein
MALWASGSPPPDRRGCRVAEFPRKQVSPGRDDWRHRNEPRHRFCQLKRLR